MFKTKSEVERHVHNCLKKINNETERTLRCFSFAKLYFNVGDYDQAYRYVSSYLTVKPKSAEGYQLLGKSLEKLGKLDAALEAYRNSLQIDPKQNNLIIKVCELLSTDNVELDLSGARYFCDLAQSFDPNNPAVYSLKERLITTDNENPDEVSRLLLKELDVRPTDVNLRVRLLKHFIHNNMIKEAYKHASEIEEKDINIFHNSINWYENFAEVLLKFQKDVSLNSELSWEFWILSVAVLERLVALSLDDRQNNKSSTDYLTAVFNFDQMLYKASQNLGGCTDRQLIATFLAHYHTQLHFHLATLVYKQAKKDVIQFKEASNIVLPTLFISYHTTPPDLQSVWFMQSPEKTKKLTLRWYKSACFRCSQAGHILLANAKDKKSLVLEKAAQYSSGVWREQLYKKIFVKRDQHLKMSTSFFVVNSPALEPTLTLPLTSDLAKYDEIAQLSFPDSLHHYIWIALNTNMPDLNIITFEGIQFSTRNLTNCSAESLNLLDIYAFIYCATLCAKFKLKDNKLTYYNLLPVSISDNLGTIQQSNFIESAYKMYKNESSSHLGDIRVLLIKGIEIVRCVGHHGLDLNILVNLAKIFDERAKKLTKQSEIDFTVARAELYWKTAVPLLEKIKNNQKISYLNNRLFELKSDDLSVNEAKSFIEKGRLFIGAQLMKKKEYDQALDIFEQLKDPYASFYQFEIYKQFVDQKLGERNIEGVSEEVKKDITMFLSKARDCLYLTLDRLREPSVDSSHPLNIQLGMEIDKIERMLSNIESDRHDDTLSEGNRSFDISIGEQYLSSLTHVSHSASSYATKMPVLNQSTPLRSSVMRQEARPSPERLDAQIRQIITSRDAIFTLVSEQNRHIIEAQRGLLEKLNAVVDDLKTIKQDVDNLKGVAKSVDDMKNSIDDFQNVVDVIQEMKKELGEFKKNDTKNQLSDEDLYVLDTDYGVDYVAPNVPSFPPSVPGAFPNYQPGRIPNPSHVAAAYAPPMLYPGLYPGLSYAYSGLNLTQPGSLPFLQDQQAANAASSIAPHLLPAHPTLPQNFSLEALSGQPLTHSIPQSIHPKEVPKDLTTAPSIPKLSTSITTPLIPSFAKAPPINVVITNSDPLPTESKPTSQPVLSVTIPAQHIKSNFLKPVSTASSTLPEPLISSLATSKVATPEKEQNNSFNKSNVSIESPEEHEPNIDFKPLIPLPDEVPVNTGEENETELFCGRAKLFRHVNVNGVKEWKERGVGNLKILKNAETGKTRILMRRDQVFKICANHFITKDLNLMPLANNDKAYMWAAQDFSEGEIARETFCIKFKLSEDAKKFFDVFEFAKNTTPITKVEPEKKTLDIPKVTSKNTSSISSGDIKESSGTSLGGFVFTGTPTFMPNEIKTPTPIIEVKDTPKSSPFSGFFFGKTETKATGLTFSPLVISQEKKDDDRASSPVEEFIPTAEFQPVIPLPELVEVKTGEENSEVLFEERTKLFRYDSSGETKEWKERGVGTIKILKDDSIRLLMRREQVHKVCCNHRVLKDMVFKANSSNPKAIMWQAQDFSEGVLKTEMFTARFKTEEIAKQFITILQNHQKTMDDNNVIVSEKKPEYNFGDAFKAKPGTWECNSCLVRNEKNVINCVACNTSKDSKEPTKSGFSFNFAPNADTTTKKPESVGFGDAFKPKPGSWECKACMLRNEESVNACVACSTPKEPGLPVGTKKPDFTFSFNTNAPSAGATKPNAGGFGDAFKAKPGSWECKTCMIRNEGSNATCLACETPRDGGLKPSLTAEKSTILPEQKFVFGIPKTTPFTTGGQTSGYPHSKITTIAQNATTTQQTWSFGFNTTPATPVNQNQETKVVDSTKTDSPFLNDKTSFSFISPTKQEFEFKQRPSRRVSQGNDESDADGTFVEEEEDNIYFKPVIPLPDKVQVKTGEEDEDVLYCHRAKLFRFVNSEWKERGLGDIKILRNKSNGKLRVVMRREQVLKICLNHILTKNIEYKPKDEKSLMFAVADFSEGELVNEQFCIRFKTPEIAEEFKKAINNALNEVPTESKLSSSQCSDDVEIIFETQVTPEEEQQAISLGLPPKFMSYKQLSDCPCEQCKKDDEYLKDLFVTETTPAAKSVAKTSVSFSLTPTTLPSVIQSPKNVADDAAKFKNTSPLLKPSVLSTTSCSTFSWPSTNIFTSSTNSFNISFPATNIFGASKSTEAKTETTNTVFSPGSTNKSIFSFSGPNNTEASINKGIFGAVATTNIFEQSVPNPITTSIFGQTTPKSTTSNIFGQGNPSTTSNIFLQNTPTTTSNIFDPTSSIFAQNTPSTTSSIFAQNTPTSTIFGPTNASTTNIFGQSTATSQNLFGANASIFGNKANGTDDGKEKTGFLFGKNSLSNVPSTIDLKETDEVVLKCDTDISFASLVANTSETKAFVKTDDKFTFLEAGAPVFGSLKLKTKMNNSKGESDDENNTSNLNEEYDPHYEPIVPLPEAVTVTTGEENETILFNERAKLFRYDADAKEWKERGVGQFKVLFHPEKNTYRLLLRREQVFKIVLNSLITANFELQPMLTSDKAWIWAGYNYTDEENSFEKLAVRFKNQELANKFRDIINDVVKEIIEGSNNRKDVPATVQDFGVEDTSANEEEVLNPLDGSGNDEYDYAAEEEDEEDLDDEEDERTVMFMKECTLSELDSDEKWEYVGEGCLQVYFDPELYAARIFITDNNDVPLSNTLIAINTVMDMNKEECTWKGVEWVEGDPKWRNLKVTFDDEHAAQEFHSNYIEGLNYAQQVGLIDEIPLECEPDD